MSDGGEWNDYMDTFAPSGVLLEFWRREWENPVVCLKDNLSPYLNADGLYWRRISEAPQQEKRSMTPDLTRDARALAVSHRYNAEMMTAETVETYARDVRVVLRALMEPSEGMRGAAARINHARDEEIWRAMIDYVLGNEP